MARSKRDIREEEIEAAAYRLLEERGFAGTGMQAIAQAAHASNETLYRWYGDKTGLYRALITRNARLIVEQIARARAEGHRGLAALERAGPVLLGAILSDRAIALNRAAAADRTGQLGPVLAEAGRSAVLPLLIEIVAEALAAGHLGTRLAPRMRGRLPLGDADPGDAAGDLAGDLAGDEAGGPAGDDAIATELTELWLALLIGDLQIRCVTGQITPPDPAQIALRSARAVDRLLRFYPPEG